MVAGTKMPTDVCWTLYVQLGRIMAVDSSGGDLNTSLSDPHPSCPEVQLVEWVGTADSRVPVAWSELPSNGACGRLRLRPSSGSHDPL